MQRPFPIVDVECQKVSIVGVTHMGKRLVTNASFKGREANRNMDSLVITMLDKVHGRLSLFGLGELNVDDMDQTTINHIHLTIYLVMEGNVLLKLAS